jgi:hypothetical protein
MWMVEYSYYNYPRLNKTFKTYESAKKFFYFIQKKNGVKRTELKEA